MGIGFQKLGVSMGANVFFLVLKALNSPLLDIYFNLSFRIHVEYIFETNKFYKAKSAYKISITENSDSEIDDKILCITQYTVIKLHASPSYSNKIRNHNDDT